VALRRLNQRDEDLLPLNPSPTIYLYGRAVKRCTYGMERGETLQSAINFKQELRLNEIPFRAD